MNRTLPIGLACLFGCGAAIGGQGTAARPAAAPAATPAGSPLASLDFLIGAWRGEGGGQPGQGGGRFTFEPDLGGRVLVRRSHSEYPAAGDRPAVVHDDLMIVYPAPGGPGPEAVYFDNEGHVIEYAVEVARDGKRVVLTSEAEPASPRFRLTYTRVGEDVVDVTFEIAPPGSPEAFKTYVSGLSKRTTRP